MNTLQLDLAQTYIHLGYISFPVGNIVSKNFYLYLEEICGSSHIWHIKISGNFVWFATVLWTLKEEKQDTSHNFLPQKKANEIGNLTPRFSSMYILSHCYLFFHSLIGHKQLLMLPLSIALLVQGASGIVARFLKCPPASAVSPIMTKFSQYNPHSTCYLV